MTTLPPSPTYDPNVPVVSSAGGGSAAYKDPKSPESIMRKTATLDAQTKMDSRYDVAEGYRVRKKGGVPKLFVFLIFFILVLFFGWKLVKFTAKVFLGFLAVILLIVIILIYKNA